MGTDGDSDSWILNSFRQEKTSHNRLRRNELRIMEFRLTLSANRR